MSSTQSQQPTAINLAALKLQTVDNKTFITLPNGEVLEFSLSSDRLYVDHREKLGGDSLDAMFISL